MEKQLWHIRVGALAVRLLGVAGGLLLGALIALGQVDPDAAQRLAERVCRLSGSLSNSQPLPAPPALSTPRPGS